MNQSESNLPNGTIREIDGRKRIYYNGYWIVFYEPPAETLADKKNLIVSLTRRAFHHTEPGINTPGVNLDHARSAYKKASNPDEKRVNAAMLAGALFNRATDIFTVIVELRTQKVEVSIENELMKQCSDCLEEAMELGKNVRHYSGMEGIDELWGEPLKAFTMTIEEFYVSRYVKLSMSMREIDDITTALIDTLGRLYPFQGIEARLMAYAWAAKQDCETRKIDTEIFEVWPKFVAAKDSVKAFSPAIPSNVSEKMESHLIEGARLLQSGRSLISYIAGARVPIPRTQKFLNQCKRYDEKTRRILEEEYLNEQQ